MGTYLTDASGRALYLWVADKKGKSTCKGQCAVLWPPLKTKGEPTASGDVKSSKLGTTTRPDGSKQVTYDGWPLYYFVKDTKPGETNGQGSNGFDAKWWLVAPSGKSITSTSTGSSSPPASSSSSSGGGGGWA